MFAATVTLTEVRLATNVIGRMNSVGIDEETFTPVICRIMIAGR